MRTKKPSTEVCPVCGGSGRIPIDQTYVSEGEWGGWSMCPSKDGWMYTQWSRVQGSRTGYVALYPYSEEYPPGTQLDKPINELGVPAAEAIVYNYKPIRTIVHGYIVK